MKYSDPGYSAMLGIFIRDICSDTLGNLNSGSCGSDSRCPHASYGGHCQHPKHPLNIPLLPEVEGAIARLEVLQKEIPLNRIRIFAELVMTNERIIKGNRTLDYQPEIDREIKNRIKKLLKPEDESVESDQ